MLKSEVTEIHRVVTKMHAVHTLLLTGTPLQNNLHELWAVLRVLHPHIFDDPAPFDDCFDLTLRKVAHAHEGTTLHSVGHRPIHPAGVTLSLLVRALKSRLRATDRREEAWDPPTTTLCAACRWIAPCWRRRTC